jgi:hypothetical protein
MEALRLRVKDLDFGRRKLLVRTGVFRRHHLHPSRIQRAVRSPPVDLKST